MGFSNAYLDSNGLIELRVSTSKTSLSEIRVMGKLTIWDTAHINSGAPANVIRLDY